MQLRPKSRTWAVTTIYQEGIIGWLSINAVVKLKRGQDSVDPYHIYKVNDKKWNSKLTFVMKSSKLSAETALKMDTRNKKTALTECVVFMDGLHSCVKDYITLTLWVENPIIEKTQRLASMECLTEDTENVTIFLQNFLDILREVKNDPQYMWKPRMIMLMKMGQTKKRWEMCLERKCDSEPFHATGTSCDVPKKLSIISIKKIRMNFLS